MLETWIERFRQRDRRALARLLSYLARGEQREAIWSRIAAATKLSRVVAVTGSAGVGKSTLVGKLIEQFRAEVQTVAVLACDPQSPRSGGALLGDRFRMPSNPDDGIFIRSLAAVSGHGAVADHLPDLVRLLEVFGFDIVLIETVGAGQGDTAVRDLADLVVLLLQPETGDDLQWEKAGVLEVADIVVVHKADLPRADHVEMQVRAALMPLDGGPGVPVLRVSARTGEGIAELARTITATPERREPHGEERHELLRLAQTTLSARFHAAEAADNEHWRRLIEEWHNRRLSDEEAVTEVFRVLNGDSSFRPDSRVGNEGSKPHHGPGDPPSS